MSKFIILPNLREKKNYIYDTKKDERAGSQLGYIYKINNEYTRYVCWDLFQSQNTQ